MLAGEFFQENKAWARVVACTPYADIPDSKILFLKKRKTGLRSIFILDLLQGFFGEEYFFRRSIWTTFWMSTCSHIINCLLWSNDFLQNSLILLRPLIRTRPNLERWGWSLGKGNTVSRWWIPTFRPISHQNSNI